MTATLTIKVTINGQTVYHGDVDQMPTHDEYVDIYEEVVNQIPPKTAGRVNDYEYRVIG